MARGRPSTGSTQRDPVLEEMRAQFNSEDARRKENFEKAINALKKLNDPNKSILPTLNAYDREKIRSYLQKPAAHEKDLRNSALYLYFRNQIIYRLCHWYADMWALDCRQVIPEYSFTKDNNPDDMLSQYENTLNLLEAYNIQGNWHDVAQRCYLEDVCYVIFFRDENNAFFYIMDPDECKIDGRYYTGEFSYSVDMSKWASATKRQLVEWLGEPLSSMLKEYDETKEKWIHMPDEYGACFKFNSDRPDLVIPPFATMLQQVAALNDIADLQALKDQAAVYRLLLIPLNVLSGAKNSDEFQVSPEILIDYYKELCKVLPDYVAASIIPGEVTNDNVIDFSTTAVDKDVDRIQQSQDTLTSTSGAGILNMKYVNSNAALAAWLKAESEFAVSSLLPQIEGFTNRMLSVDIKGTACKVKYFDCTVFTKDELRDSLLSSCQYSFSNRMAYNTFNGISEKATMAMEFFETNVLHLPEIMTHPLQSSYTTAGGETVDDEGGRPQSDPISLSPSGERSRNQ